jgi:hypothetical protein
METLRRNAFRRGLLGGSRPWMFLGVLAYTARALRWMARKDTEVLFSEELQPGEQLVIRTIEPPPRRRRRKR